MQRVLQQCNHSQRKRGNCKGNLRLTEELEKARLEFAEEYVHCKEYYLVVRRNLTVLTRGITATVTCEKIQNF